MLPARSGVVGPLRSSERRLWWWRRVRPLPRRYSPELDRALAGDWSGINDTEEAAVSAFFQVQQLLLCLVAKR